MTNFHWAVDLARFASSSSRFSCHDCCKIPPGWWTDAHTEVRNNARCDSSRWFALLLSCIQGILTDTTFTRSALPSSWRSWCLSRCLICKISGEQLPRIVNLPHDEWFPKHKSQVCIRQTDKTSTSTLLDMKTGKLELFSGLLIPGHHCEGISSLT